MISVLINAYACAPDRGSEPGVGWNWILHLSRHCRLFVITEGEWRAQIEEAVAKLPQKDAIHFFYLPVSERIRAICWHQGDWRFYYYYRQWQREAFRLASRIVEEYPIDLIHHLNMIGFREPGYLWKIKGVPFVWGPIGGMNLFPGNYLAGLDAKNRWKIRLKNLLNEFQMRYHPRVKQAMRRADALLSATPESRQVIRRIYKRDSYPVSETGCDRMEVAIDSGRFRTRGTFDILWVGRFFYAKQLNIALETIARLKDLDVRLHIVGDGSAAEVTRYKDLADRLSVGGQCVWHGKIPHAEVLGWMRKAHLFFFTSVSEATSSVVSEALQNRLPVVCFDTCGFGAIVSERVGRKIRLSNPGKSASDFAAVIRGLYRDRSLLEELSSTCAREIGALYWEYKAGNVLSIYHQVLNGYAK